MAHLLQVQIVFAVFLTNVCCEVPSTVAIKLETADSKITYCLKQQGKDKVSEGSFLEFSPFSSQQSNCCAIMQYTVSNGSSILLAHDKSMCVDSYAFLDYATYVNSGPCSLKALLLKNELKIDVADTGVKCFNRTSQHAMLINCHASQFQTILESCDVNVEPGVLATSHTPVTTKVSEEPATSATTKISTTAPTISASLKTSQTVTRSPIEDLTPNILYVKVSFSTSRYQGLKLINHVTFSSEVKDLTTCSLLCQSHNICWSYNFKFKDQDTTHLCLLNNATHKSYPDDLKEDQDFIYYYLL